MEDVSLEQALDDYKSIHMPARNFSERTRVEYSNDLEGLVDYLLAIGVKMAREITLHNVERFLADLDHKEISGATRKRKVVSIRSFLSFLYQSGYVRTDVSKNLIPPFVEPKAPRFLTEAEYNRLREVSQGNSRDHAIIELFLQTGIRLSELTRMTVNDVDLPATILPGSKVTGAIHILGSERRKGRAVTLNHKACRALRTYLDNRLEGTSLVLFLNRFGKPLSSRGVEKMLDRYFRQSRISGASVRSLRHTFGIQHAIMGTSVNTIREAMGHKDHRSTEVYIMEAKELVNREMQDHAL
jgi:site-specific recombinase XerD